MKRVNIYEGALMLLGLSFLVLPEKMIAQEEESSPFNVGGDLVSSYLWRGTKFGTSTWQFL